MSHHPLLAFDQQFGGIVCGLDEAGRGPWAGPVVAGAVIWPQEIIVPAALNDSKKLTAKKRDQLYDVISRDAIAAIGLASVEEIDSMNILAASMLAMQRAYSNLEKIADIILVDGNRCPKLPCQSQAVIKGDSKSAAIAAASIIAKVTRDRMMAQLAQEFPHYGFERHAGYGTAQHQHALAEHGVTPHHRRSFAPIRKLLEAAA